MRFNINESEFNNANSYFFESISMYEELSQNLISGAPVYLTEWDSNYKE